MLTIQKNKKSLYKGLTYNYMQCYNKIEDKERGNEKNGKIVTVSLSRNK